MAFGGGHIVDPPASQTSLGGPFLPLVGGTLTGDLIITPAANDTHTLKVNQAGGTTDVFTVDTLDSQAIFRGIQDEAVGGAPIAGVFTFSSWTVGAGWTTTATTLVGATASTTATSTFTPTIGQWYLMQIGSQSITAGSIVVTCGGFTSQALSVSSNYQFLFKATTTAALTVTGTGFSGTIFSDHSKSFIETYTPSNPVVVLHDSTGVTSLELRGTLNSDQNVGIGTNALLGAESGGLTHNNVAIGVNAMRQARGCVDNVIIGSNAQSQAFSATDNVAIGSQAMQFCANATFNIAFGFQALRNITGGFNNIAIGSAAGLTVGAGQGNILIGPNIDVPTSTTNHLLNIGGVIIGNTSSGLLTQYNSNTLAGLGIPSITGSSRSTAQTAAVASVATFTVGASDGSFYVSANVNVTTATNHNFTTTVTYTDETNTSRTLTLTYSSLTGTLLTAITNVTGAGPYEGVPMHIRAKAATAITIATTGTFTTVTYNVEGLIQQVA